MKAFGNFGYTLPTGVQLYAHTSYARKQVSSGVFYRNPNTRLGVFSNGGGRTLLVGDVLAANGMGSADCCARRAPPRGVAEAIARSTTGRLCLTATRPTR